jgi:hypothetical protein
VLVLSSQSASAIELAVNGGFETGDFTGWTQFPTGPGQQTVDAVNPSSGLYSGKIFNDAPPSNSLMKQANLAAGLLTPGQTVNISFDARGELGIGGVSFAEFFTELDGGGVSSAQILGGGPLALDADPNVWKNFMFSTVVGPVADGGVTLQLGTTLGANPGTSSSMWYDNVSITVDSLLVPEPTSLALVSLLGLMLTGRRQK